MICFDDELTVPIVEKKVTLTLENDGAVKATFESGFSLTVTANNFLLSQVFSGGSSLNNVAKGLLGKHRYDRHV